MVESLRRYFASTEFELIEKIGEGGFGEVWKAQRRLESCELDYDEFDETESGGGEIPGSTDSREDLPEWVAIKILFEESGALGPELTHPNIVRVFQTGQVLSRPYQVMEWIEGPTLRAFMDQIPARFQSSGFVDLTLVRRFILALLDGLEFAHSRGIIHRDIKPENILLQPDAGLLVPKLADFGLATHSHDKLQLSASLNSSHNIAGSALYIAPELIRFRQPASQAADIFALGVVLFELLTGQVPTGLEYPSEIRRGLPRGFDELLKTMLARTPETRPGVTLIRQKLLQLFGLRGSQAVFLSPSKKEGRGTARDSIDPVRVQQGSNSKVNDAMVLIEGCSFVQGDDKDPFARPKRLVNLDSFWVDRTPVTNAQYLEFCQQTGAAPPSTWKIKASSWTRRQTFRLAKSALQLPVTGVTWHQAKAYAEWVGKRLLTEAEWERCAQGPRGWPYPYGERFDATKIAETDKALCAVEAHESGASLDGVLDLTGNCWEWCADWFDRLAYSGDKDCSNPTGPEQGRSRVIRGGYSPALPGSGTAFFRARLRPDLSQANVGFRCARSVDFDNASFNG